MGNRDDRGLWFVDPSRLADMDEWHRQVEVIRREEPVLEVEVDGFEKFWAVTRHEDVFAIERDSRHWLNTSRVVLGPDAHHEKMVARGMEPRSLVHLDGKVHNDVRHVVNDWFKPAAVKRRQPRVDEIADVFVERMRDLGGACDFARDIAVPYTLRVIMDIYGVPEEDERLMLELTQGVFGAADPEFSTSNDAGDQVLESVLKFVNYFNEMTVDRRACPADDLATVIANGQIDGCPMGDLERLWLYIIVATAGHDTTSYGLAGGMEALITHPDELAKLRDDPELIGNATEEIIRWTSPVRHFMRYATDDTEIRGVKIAAGQRVYLSYPSANRDEDAFRDPMTFDITRSDTDNLLSFGVGAHFCLGAQFARREIRTMIGKLTDKLAHVELAGPPRWSEGGLVSGVKHLPISYSWRPGR
ncbi:MAG: cytochrome P450 [Acidobacteriota bacterium]|nr:cytochrome P450 [Acidobacteriota bacterium]